MRSRYRLKVGGGRYQYMSRVHFVTHTHRCTHAHTTLLPVIAGPESVDTALSLTCRLPAIPSAGTNAEKMKITYSLTTGAFWTKLSKSHSAKPPSTAAAPLPLFAFN